MKAAAERLGISRYLLYQWIKAGEVRYRVYPGSGRKYFREEDLDIIEKAALSRGRGGRS